MRGIKMLHVLGSLNPSGAEMMLKTASNLWKSEGIEGHIISTGDQKGRFSDELTKAGYIINHLPFSLGVVRWIISYFILLISLNPGIVHVHAEKSCFLTTVIPRVIGIPVCRTVHNVFKYQGILRWRKMIGRRLSSLLGCYYVSIGSSVFDHERKILNNKTLLLWNWYDENNFRQPSVSERQSARSQLGVDKDTIIIVSVGNGNDVKNYSSIISAMHLLSNQLTLEDHHPTNIHYFMVGREHPKSLERIDSVRLGVEHKVTFCGTQSDVRKYLWAADIFIMPSLYEGLGISAIEAMATGVTTVLADVPGLMDFAQFNLPIVWCSPDAHGVYEAVLRVIRTAGSLSRNSLMAETVREKLSCAKNAPEYLKLWRRIYAR